MHVCLLNRRTQQTVQGQISPMSVTDAQRLEESWVPAFHQRYRDQHCDADFPLWRPQSVPFADDTLSGVVRAFVLIIDEIIWGVLFLQTTPEPSRTDSSLPLLYLRYVATAPWNRGDRHQKGSLRGVGSSLITLATSLSHQAGCGGRIGLHSIRGSEVFYERLNFQSFGQDAAHWGMCYFESRSTETAAQADSENPFRSLVP